MRDFCGNRHRHRPAHFWDTTTLLALALVALAGCDAPAPPDSIGEAAPKRVNIIELVESVGSEESRQGVLAGLAASGLREGTDYEVTHSSAHGEMSLLPTIVDAANTAGVDLFITISTPTLQAVLQRGGGVRTVFTFTANPVLAGAGWSNDDHLPHVTGIFTLSDFSGLIQVLVECMPNASSVGTLFCPAEVNSVYYRDELARVAGAAGIELVSVPVSTSSDVPDAAAALCESGIDAICQLYDNLTGSTFPGIVIAARRAGKPLFAFSSGHVAQGAAVAVARDYEDAGHDAGLLAARVLRGESPSGIPFRLAKRTELVVSPTNASRFGFTIPEPVLARASRIISE